MGEAKPPLALAEARSQFDVMVQDIRPELHRYCARMTGSVIDGEDVMQDALAKAFFQLASLNSMPELRPWLFRIAHNRCIDQLRRNTRHQTEVLDELPDASDYAEALETSEIAEIALTWYVKLTALQRSCVILMDVMGYSMAELSTILDMSLPAIKGALHRGRAALRQHASESRDGARAPLDPDEEKLLAQYVVHFNGRNFDALRDLLADDARLELVGRTSARGARAVGNYFGNYEKLDRWRVELGRVDGRAALLGFDGEAADVAHTNNRPMWFILVEWNAGRVQSIRDYRYARYVTELAVFA